MNARRFPVRFDPEPLQRDLDRFAPTEWTDHFVTQNYEGNWSVLPLRGPRGATHPVKMIYSDPTCTDFSDTPFLERAPALREVLDWFRCPLGVARLMKLTPGSRILEHRDHDLELELGVLRVHVPVRTNPGVEFVLAGEPVVMGEGECWYLKLSEPHSVTNRGAADRVHLVIDAFADDWVRENLGVVGA